MWRVPGTGRRRVCFFALSILLPLLDLAPPLLFPPNPKSQSASPLSSCKALTRITSLAFLSLPMDSYKQRHEQFVSDLSGGRVSEIYLVSLVVPIAFISGWLVSRNLDPRARVLADFIFVWAVPLAALSIYSGRTWLLIAALIAPALFLGQARPEAASKPKKSPSRSTRRETQLTQPPYLDHKPYLTVYRASLLINTAIAILAVDFPVFPRRFAKVETWGTSVMDLGVGSFVFSMGIVSARPTLRYAINEKYPPFWKALKDSLQHSAKVLALGVVRLISVKYLGYQEHVSEYGVHWNFFMTLGLLPPLMALLQPFARLVRLPMLVLGLLVAFAHEIVLKNTGLMEWALSAPRTDILSTNKEGVTSFWGFLAIFMIGQSVGYYVLPTVLGKGVSSFLYPQTPRQIKEPAPNPQRRVFYYLAATAVTTHGLFYVLRIATEPSRRLANLPYIIWVTSFSTGFLALFVLGSDVLNYEATASQVAVNRRGQSTFLLSNVLTGLVNMSVKTIDQPRERALIILLAYTAAVFVISRYLF